jgi:cell division transport system permease protein
MMGLSYAAKIAMQSLFRDKWINLLSILTIAAGLFFIALSGIALLNVDSATRRLPEKFSMMIYLEDNVSGERRNEIIGRAKSDTSVHRADFIPKDVALKELRADMKGMEDVIGNLGENPLPDAIEIKFDSDSVNPETVRNLSRQLKELRGVREVGYGENFLSSVHSIRRGVKTLGILFLSIMSAGMLFVCYSTVKILFHRRERDIETFKLLGATRGFIRMPFLIEGAVIGLCGGLAGSLGLLGVHYSVILRLKQSFPLFDSLIFPSVMIVAAPLAGLLLGVLGSLAAIGRIRY